MDPVLSYGIVRRTLQTSGLNCLGSRELLCLYYAVLRFVLRVVQNKNSIKSVSYVKIVEPTDFVLRPYYACRCPAMAP